MKVRDIFLIENPLTWFCTVLLVVVFSFFLSLHPPWSSIALDKQEAFGWTSWADGGSTPASGGQCDDDNDDE